MSLHNTREAIGLSGLTRPTFTRRARALKIRPEVRWGDSAHYWSDEQIDQIRNPPARCPDCKSPYHDSCYMAVRRAHRDENRDILSERDI